ncbi:nucleoside/nucleotide kinase family protein [Actinophytocola xanthii]|uniref:Uridine kinase n=1 Tax=Actinophytocola xanthii TaxID=1912961 RepID=A0A1Q8C1M6_9PSEU|nr:uridine kinase [Actinophytocola xanthii]OLF08258.1 uridine kinase [Actinophytocola xanthii]
MRAQVIADVADAVRSLPEKRFQRVAVDGVDGAGKTYFADELADELRGRGTPVVRASVDGFHNPQRTRYRLGRRSPEGFYRDSYDYGRFMRLLLDPFGPEGSGAYVPEVYDVRREREVRRPPALAEPGSVLVVDGIFTHRDELVRFWDFSVWLDVPFEVSIPRGGQRGDMDPDPRAESNRRYVEGQRIYFAQCSPRTRASMVVDNSDLANPVITVRSGAGEADLRTE